VQWYCTRPGCPVSGVRFPGPVTLRIILRGRRGEGGTWRWGVRFRPSTEQYRTYRNLLFRVACGMNRIQQGPVRTYRREQCRCGRSMFINHSRRRFASERGLLSLQGTMVKPYQSKESSVYFGDALLTTSSNSPLSYPINHLTIYKTTPFAHPFLSSTTSPPQMHSLDGGSTRKKRTKQDIKSTNVNASSRTKTTAGYWVWLPLYFDIRIPCA